MDTVIVASPLFIQSLSSLGGVLCSPRSIAVTRWYHLEWSCTVHTLNGGQGCVVGWQSSYIVYDLVHSCRKTRYGQLISFSVSANCGKLFHARGPATEKLLLPSSVLVFVWAMRHRLSVSADWRYRLTARSVTGTQSSARYGGASPCRHL